MMIGCRLIADWLPDDCLLAAGCRVRIRKGRPNLEIALGLGGFTMIPAVLCIFFSPMAVNRINYLKIRKTTSVFWVRE